MESDILVTSAFPLCKLLGGYLAQLSQSCELCNVGMSSVLFCLSIPKTN